MRTRLLGTGLISLLGLLSILCAPSGCADGSSGGCRQRTDPRPTVQVYNPQTKTWSLGPKLPFDAGEVLATGQGRHVYFAVGLAFFRLDVEQKIYETLEVMPTIDWPVDLVSSATTIYGLGADGTAPALVAFDIPTRTWRTEPMPLSSARGGVEVNGLLYSVGEVDGTLDVYDPVSGVWMVESMLPSGMWLTSPVTDGSRIFAFDFGFRRTWIYDTAGRVWTPGPDIPGSFVAIDAVVIENRIYLPTPPRAPTRTLNMISFNWAFVGKLPRDRSEFGVAAAGEKLYCLGGYAPDPCTD